MSEYAVAGVDPEKIDPFKAAMRKMGARTTKFPERRGVIIEDGSFWYGLDRSHAWRQVTEGLGNKNWIAEWMYQETRDARYFLGIGIDTIMMAAVDLLRHGAMPVVYTDEVAAGSSEWFEDEERRAAIVNGFFQGCRLTGMALLGGESPSLSSLVRARPPVAGAPVFSGCATGIIAPRDAVITGNRLHAGAVILGAPSSGVHANGISLIIRRALDLREKFFTTMPNGRELGAEALIPTASYVGLVDALMRANVDILAMAPITGGGLAKFAAASARPLIHCIEQWPERIPPLLAFMFNIGVPLEECLRTFNWGIGYAVYVREAEASRAMAIAERAGCPLQRLGRVENGPRHVVVQKKAIPGLSEDLRIPPPGA